MANAIWPSTDVKPNGRFCVGASARLAFGSKTNLAQQFSIVWTTPIEGDSVRLAQSSQA